MHRADRTADAVRAASSGVLMISPDDNHPRANDSGADVRDEGRASDPTTHDEKSRNRSKEE
jgi:hypothetical protein